MLFSLTVIANFSVRLFCWLVFGYVPEYLCGYLVYIVVCLVPSCGVYYFLDVDQKMVEVLRMCSNLIVGGFYLMIVLDIWRRHL